MPLQYIRSLLRAKPTDSPDIGNLPRRDLFSAIASKTTRISGGRYGFGFAFGLIFVWGISGPFFHFSDAWQLAINSTTSVLTFLMVFLIQNAQNRESKALHLKLDELILSTRRARNELIDVELLTEEQLDRLAERYRRVSQTVVDNRDDDKFLDPFEHQYEQPRVDGRTADPATSR